MPGKPSLTCAVSPGVTFFTRFPTVLVLFLPKAPSLLQDVKNVQLSAPHLLRRY